MKVFIDMDGVLVDFLGGMAKVHNRKLPYDIPENLGKWDTEVLWGISGEEFWRPIHEHGHKFWIDLCPTEEAHALIQIFNGVVGEANVSILTTPSSDPGFYRGKAAWIKNHFPQFNDRIIFAKSKETIAEPGRILLDDKDQNISRWKKAGGLGILVPRLWNSQFEREGGVIERVTKELFMMREE